MRFRAVAVALAAALLGGVVALGIGRELGWTGPAKTVQTVVFRPGSAQQAQASPAAVLSAAKPLAGNGFDPARIYASRSPGVVTITSIFGSSSAAGAEQAQGSGFVVSRDGYILTNSHVITDAGQTAGAVAAANQLYVDFQDHDRVPARVVGWDVFDDVGLIKVDPKLHALDPVPLGNSAAVVVGAPVAAIGSPFGNEGSLSVGVFSATKRSVDSLTSRYSLVDAIQTDAPINHGNSGGPLFDARGRVIGITAQIRSDSGGAEGVGFAVPIDSARRSMDQLIAHGSVSYAYVGVLSVDLTPSLARHFGYPVLHGAAISKVIADSPAARAGLRAGTSSIFDAVDFPKGADVIVAIDGLPVRNKEDVVRVVTNRLAPGQVATLTVYRAGRRLTVPVTLGTRQQNP
jgi:2-alkenal reductase